MLSEFIGNFLIAIFGRNWRTSLSMLITVVAGFINMNNDLLPNPDGFIARFSGYVMLGGLAAWGINSKDKQVSGTRSQVEDFDERER
jgi:hypothetical protein